MLLIITLVFFGLFLLAVELLIVPGFGIPGILGLLSIIGAAILAFLEFGQGTGIIVLSSIILTTAVTTWLILRSKTWKNISLSKSITHRVGESADQIGMSSGMTGNTLSRINPMGKAKINGIEIEVTSLGKLIDARRRVEVISVDGNKVFVKEIK